MQWIAATATTRGRHHVARGQPNEDHASTTTDGVVIAAVADGHGAPTYTRAERGSRLATATALDVLGDPPPAEELPGLLVTGWRDRVAADVDDDAPPRSETRGQPAHVLYGTTLLAARVLDDDRLLLAQLGDGDVLLWSATDGVALPLPNPETPFPNATDSLVQGDAPSSVRTAVTDAPDLVLLATDGLEAARRAPGWEQAAMQQLRDDLIEAGADGVQDVLQRWTEDGAAAGGDDTTLAVLVRRELFGRSGT